jgi:hypothetical protein
MNIDNLIQKYNESRNHYLSSKYNETQLRADFLDPFFEILGWDITNKEAKLTNEREVLLEEPLKATATSNTKKPDYTFRLFSERKFFLEAKKPSVKIDSNPESAKQVRRYGFTAKLKISVLSNFEYLIIYDTSKQVIDSDTVTTSQIKLYHYSEYIKKLEEIKLLLGKESVYSGQFDIEWQDIEEQLKKFSVDTLFLEQINSWRLLLGQEIFLYDNSIEITELNDMVQSYINSILFLRVCEDRNLEEYKTLLNFAQREDHEALIAKFKASDKKYNAGLFENEIIEEIITNSSSAFWIIINQLYYPQTTYSFAVFSSDILGHIYEIFLGEELTVVDNEITLEKKPENQDRDIVTTPTYIVQDILRRTVVEYCKDKSHREILNSKFADIACGSGAFLLELYQVLHDILVDYYLANNPTVLIQTSVNSFKLPFEIKKQIIEECIYGVDKDFNAVEASKFGLLLKLLENEDLESLSVPILPNLEETILYGNSLIGSVDENSEIINPYDFGELKFDVIVGNPPYMSTKDMKKFTLLEKPIYEKNYISAYKQYDKYFLFVERGLDLLSDDGYLGYILPNKFIKVGAGKNLRELLVERKSLHTIISFGSNQIFDNKSTYTSLLILRKEEQERLHYCEVGSLKQWKIRDISQENFDKIPLTSLKNDWLLVPKYLKKVFQKIQEQSILLDELIESDNIFNGIQTSANLIYIHKPINEDDDEYIYFKKDEREWKIEKELTKPYFKTPRGDNDFYTYRPLVPNSFVIYPYRKTENKIELVDINELEHNYPNLYKYLVFYKNKLDNKTRDIQPLPETSDEWYRYGRHQSLDKCAVKAKIVVGILSQGDKYVIDFNETLISSGGTAGYCMITLPKEFAYSIYYIQALLNSKYLEWFSSIIGEVFRGGYIARGTKILKRLPIRIIDFENERDKELHNAIAKSQKELIAIQMEIDKNSKNKRKLTPLKRQFQTQKNHLDKLLKELYNLEDDNLIPLISEIYGTN